MNKTKPKDLLRPMMEGRGLRGELESASVLRPELRGHTHAVKRDNQQTKVTER